MLKVYELWITRYIFHLLIIIIGIERTVEWNYTHFLKKKLLQDAGDGEMEIIVYLFLITIVFPHIKSNITD